MFVAEVIFLYSVIYMLSQKTQSNVLFILHCILTAGAYAAPFLINWKILVPVFVATILQHAIWGRCLLNAKHGLSEEDGSTFYSEAFERMGFRPNKTKIRFFVRKILYALLTAVTLLWQVVLGKEPLWF